MHQKSFARAVTFWGMVLLVLWVGPLLTSAQNETVTVPDVTGLTVPQAAAELNRSGLRMGVQTAKAWTSASATEPGTIGEQHVSPGDTVSYGTAVDVTVLSTANVRLVYDDNDLTVVNNTGSPLDLTRIVFSSADGTKRFQAARWRASLDAADCTQIWSISRSNAKDIDGCSSVYWLTTNNPDEHFWTQTAAVQSFEIVQDSVSLTSCDAAPPGSQDSPLLCEFFVVSGVVNSSVTEYVYFAYTTDHFAAVNTSSDAWMPLDATSIQIPGLELRIGDPVLFGNPDIVADLSRLAPGQCSLLTVMPETDATPPENCDLIAQTAVASSSQAFWTVAFEVLPVTRPGERLICPAATEGHITICVMPR